MCHAIPMAALLLALLAGLTLLRLARPGSPNADLMAEALHTLEAGPCPDTRPAARSAPRSEFARLPPASRA